MFGNNSDIFEYFGDKDFKQLKKNFVPVNSCQIRCNFNSMTKFKHAFKKKKKVLKAPCPLENK